MNDTDKFYATSNYYLEDIFNGEIVRNKVNINKVLESNYHLNNKEEVRILSKSKVINEDTGVDEYIPLEKTGFIKCSTNKYQDDLDIINSEIATLLGIRSANVFRLIGDDLVTGTVSIDVVNDNEKLITIDAVAKDTILKIKNEHLEIEAWLKNYVDLPDSTEENPITDIKSIKTLLNFPLELLKYYYELNDKELLQIKKDYISMLLFDYITNLDLRTLSTYGIIYNNDSKKIRLSPIYDFSNKIEYSNVMKINNKYVDKEVFISCLFLNYYEDFKDISRGLNENLSSYKKSIKLIIDNNTSSEYQSDILNNISKSLDIIMVLEKDKRLVFGESRIDMALTQTSINLNAVNRNQEVRKKYENAKKYSNNPVTVKEEKVSKRIVKEDKIDNEIPIKSNDEEELVKISVEEEKKSSNIGSYIFTIIFVLILVAICVGGIYYLINYLKD